MERTPTPHRITVDEYYDMDRTGLLEPDARVELIEGEVVHVPSIGSPRASIVAFLDHLLDRALADRACVRGQLPVRLDHFSEVGTMKQRPRQTLVLCPFPAFPASLSISRSC